MGRKSRKHKSHKQKPYRYKPQKRKSKSKKPIILILAFCLIVAVVVIYSMARQGRPSLSKVLLSTNMGDITIQLYDDMPITTENFKKLVQQGTYDGTIFHRVIDGFMIQGGDPTGTGYGDSSIPSIKDEFTDHNRNDRGTISMANSGPNTGSSQFFINIVDNNYLDSKHPVFGKVIEGMDVVDNIAKVETDENDRPLQDVRIVKAELIS
jgi:peptidylprolyl isomerase